MAGAGITGRQILERWGMLPFELIGMVLAGELVAVDPFSGEKHSKENDNCFFCKREMKYYTPCHARKAYIAWNNVEGTCSNKMRAEYRSKQLFELKFNMKEVEEYEEKNELAKNLSKDKEVSHLYKQKEDSPIVSNYGWLTGQEIMDGLFLLPFQLAWICFMFDVDVVCPRRGTILSQMTQFISAEWYKDNSDAIRKYGPVSESMEILIKDLLDKTKTDDLSLEMRYEIFDFWTDKAGGFLFNRQAIEEAERIYVHLGVIEPYFTKESLVPFSQTGQAISDNPLDFDHEVQQADLPPTQKFNTPKEHRDHLYAQDPNYGRIMKELQKRWPLKKLEAAAIALGEAVPETKEERERFGERWRYHTSKLKQDE